MPKKRTKRPTKIAPQHPLCRPPSGAIDVRVLGANGRWKKDDGKPGLAFFGVKKIAHVEGEEDVEAWVANCTCKIWNDCPASKALTKAAEIYDAASLVRLRARAR